MIGLKKKAADAKEAEYLREKLAQILETAGAQDLEYAVLATGAEPYRVMEAATALEEKGRLDVKRGLLGEVTLKPRSETKPTGSKEDILHILEGKSPITVKEASARLHAPTSVVSEWSRCLEEDGLIKLSGGFLKEKTMRKIKAAVAAYFAKKALEERRQRAGTVWTNIDLAYAIAAETGGVTSKDAAEAVGVAVCDIEEYVRVAGGLLVLDYPLNPAAHPILRSAKPIYEMEETAPQGTILQKYEILLNGIKADVIIFRNEEEPIPCYELGAPKIAEATDAALKSLKAEIKADPKIGYEERRSHYKEKALNRIRKTLGASDEDANTLASHLADETVGIGEMSLLFFDDELEKIQANIKEAKVTAYHRRFGWVKTNLRPCTKERLAEAAQHTEGPIIESRTKDGDSITAVFEPLSDEGTVTIAKASRRPWTLAEYAGRLDAMSPEMAAFLWTAVQYELNIIVTGPAASGKSTLLNILCSLAQPTQTIVTIEETRQLRLPKTMRLNWIPLHTCGRPHLKDRLQVGDILEVAAKMKPRRIVLDEIKGQKAAEALFETMRSHTVYSTAYAGSSDELAAKLGEHVKGRLDRLHVIVTMDRDLSSGRIRVVEIAEPLVGGGVIHINRLYRWEGGSGYVMENDSIKAKAELQRHANMGYSEFQAELRRKKKAVEDIAARTAGLDEVGKAVEKYYTDALRLFGDLPTLRS